MKTKPDVCYRVCKYYGSSMDGMQCNHPEFSKNSDPYANMIITQSNSREGNRPKECPLNKKTTWQLSGFSVFLYITIERI